MKTIRSKKVWTDSFSEVQQFYEDLETLYEFYQEELTKDGRNGGAAQKWVEGCIDNFDKQLVELERLSTSEKTTSTWGVW